MPEKKQSSLWSFYGLKTQAVEKLEDDDCIRVKSPPACRTNPPIVSKKRKHEALEPVQRTEKTSKKPRRGPLLKINDRQGASPKAAPKKLKGIFQHVLSEYPPTDFVLQRRAYSYCLVHCLFVFSHASGDHHYRASLFLMENPALIVFSCSAAV